MGDKRIDRKCGRTTISWSNLKERDERAETGKSPRHSDQFFKLAKIDKSSKKCFKWVVRRFCEKECLTQNSTGKQIKRPMMQYDKLEIILTFRQLPVEFIWNKEGQLHLKYEYLKPWRKNEKFTNRFSPSWSFPWREIWEIVSWKLKMPTLFSNNKSCSVIYFLRQLYPFQN